MIVSFLKKTTFLLIVLLSLFFPFKKVLAAEKWCGYKATTGIVMCKFGDCTSDATCIPATCYDDKADCDKIAIGANQIITDKAAADAAAAAQQQAAAQATSNKWCGYKTSSGVVSCKQGICSADPACIPVTCHDVKTDCDKIAITATQSIADKAAADAAVAAQQQATAQATANNWCGYKTSSGVVSCKQGICSADPACIPVTCWPVQSDCIKSAAEATQLLKDQIKTTACGNQKTCTKIDKECKSENDCNSYGGVGICKDGFCWLDDISMQKFKSIPTLFGIQADLQIRKPILAIDIPQLDFTDVQNSIDEEGYLHLPYIGEYMSAIYKFAMVIVSIIGVIMIIVVGVKIVVLGGEEKVAGFKKIGQITIGLFIAWGSYAILYNINPDLVNFKALKVKYIEKEELQTISLTNSDLTDAAIGEGAPDQFKYFTKCPVNLTQPIYFGDGTTSLIPNLKKNPAQSSLPNNIPRRLEFHEKMVTQQILKGSMAQRVAMATEAAAQCQIQYEDCGVGTTNVYALAAATGGSYGASERCLLHAKNTKKGPRACNSLGINTAYTPKTMLHDVTGLNTSYGLKVSQLTRGMFKGADCKTKVWPEPSFDNEDQATAKLVSILKATGKWDPNWINELKPGDYYMIVNWNPYCPGTHSALFLGWKDPAQHIAWVQMGDAGHFIRVGTKKLGNEAIIQISRPKEK